MKLLNRHTDYAVTALAFIGRTDTPVSASEICRELNMPRAFIRGILQKLSAAGMLLSARGKGGGFVLAQPAQQISLLGVMNLFQDTMTADGCVLRRKACPRRSTCRIRASIHEIGSLVTGRLAAISVADLIKETLS